MTSELAAKPTDAEKYKLFVREGKSGIYFKNRDEGIWLSREGIGWFAGGASRTKNWNELVRVHLASGFIPKHGASAICGLFFKDGMQLNVLTGSAWGHVEDERNECYGRFLDDLHRRIPPAHRSAVSFRAGNTRGRQIALTVALVVASIFFVLLPLALAVILRKLEALLIALAGAGFVWPVWRVAGANEPRDYNPEQVPPELYP